MRRYITYNGVSSEDLGVRLISMPQRFSPSTSGESKAISGRHGDVFLSTGARNVFKLEQTCSVRRSGISVVCAWLSDSGLLVYSDEPQLGWEARIDEEVKFERVSNDPDPLYRFTVNFVCQPFARALPEAEPILITATGTLINNPYLTAAYPRITVIGQGEIELNIGRYTCFLEDIEDGIIIDSELLDAFNLEGTLLANDKLGGEFPRLEPGDQYISWTGSVVSVTIEPRWRTL